MKQFRLKWMAGVLLGAGVLFAQEKPLADKPEAPATAPKPAPASRGNTPPPPAMLPPGNRPMPRYDRAALDLSPENRGKMEEVNKAYSTEASPLLAKLGALRRDLDALVSQEKLNESGMRAKAKEIGELEGDLAVARAKRYGKLVEFLPPEQARRLSQTPALSRPFQPSLHNAPPPAELAPPQK